MLPGLGSGSLTSDHVFAAETAEVDRWVFGDQRCSVVVRAGCVLWKRETGSKQKVKMAGDNYKCISRIGSTLVSPRIGERLGWQRREG